MSKIEKERKNDTADISVKVTYKRTRIERAAHEFQANWDLVYTYFQSCNPIRVKKGFSN